MAVERRRYPRFECAGTASVQIAVDDPPLLGRIANISVNGCLIYLQDPGDLACDTVVELSFRINDVPFRVWGKVKVARGSDAYGFEFPLLSERVRSRLESLIAQLVEDFLTIQSLRSHGERRRHPRFECMGKAHVQLKAGESLYTAKVVNISSGGCLLEFPDPQNLEEDAVVEMEFSINQTPMRLLGQVKSHHSERRVGFQFAPMITPLRRQLDDLIEELIQRIVKRLTEPTQEAQAS